MPIRFDCSCGRTTVIKNDAMAGRKAKCPGCQAVFVIPLPEGAAPSAGPAVPDAASAGQAALDPAPAPPPPVRPVARPVVGASMQEAGGCPQCGAPLAPGVFICPACGKDARGPAALAGQVFVKRHGPGGWRMPPWAKMLCAALVVAGIAAGYRWVIRHMEAGQERAELDTELFALPGPSTVYKIANKPDKLDDVLYFARHGDDFRKAGAWRVILEFHGDAFLERLPDMYRGAGREEDAAILMLAASLTKTDEHARKGVRQILTLVRPEAGRIESDKKWTILTGVRKVPSHQAVGLSTRLLRYMTERSAYDPLRELDPTPLDLWLEGRLPTGDPAFDRDIVYLVAELRGAGAEAMWRTYKKDKRVPLSETPRAP